MGQKLVLKILPADEYDLTLRRVPARRFGHPSLPRKSENRRSLSYHYDEYHPTTPSEAVRGGKKIGESIRRPSWGGSLGRGRASGALRSQFPAGVVFALI